MLQVCSRQYEAYAVFEQHQDPRASAPRAADEERGSEATGDGLGSRCDGAPATAAAYKNAKPDASFRRDVDTTASHSRPGTDERRCEGTNRRLTVFNI